MATAEKLGGLVCSLVGVLLKCDPGQCDRPRPPSSYPAHRLRPSIRWCRRMSRCSCYRLLRSDTGSAADSQRRKTPQGILGQNIQKRHVFHLCVCWVFFMFPPTFCAVGSGPTWRARTLSTGRVADAAVTAAAGLVTPSPVGTRGARCQRGTTTPQPLHELCPSNVCDQCSGLAGDLWIIFWKLVRLCCNSLRLQERPIQPAGQEQWPLT